MTAYLLSDFGQARDFHKRRFCVEMVQSSRIINVDYNTLFMFNETFDVISSNERVTIAT